MLDPIEPLLAHLQVDPPDIQAADLDAVASRLIEARHSPPRDDKHAAEIVRLCDGVSRLHPSVRFGLSLHGVTDDLIGGVHRFCDEYLGERAKT